MIGTGFASARGRTLSFVAVEGCTAGGADIVLCEPRSALTAMNATATAATISPTTETSTSRLAKVLSKSITHSGFGVPRSLMGLVEAEEDSTEEGELCSGAGCFAPFKGSDFFYGTRRDRLLFIPSELRRPSCSVRSREQTVLLNPEAASRFRIGASIAIARAAVAAVGRPRGIRSRPPLPRSCARSSGLPRSPGRSRHRS